MPWSLRGIPSKDGGGARVEHSISKKAGETTVRVHYAETDPWGIAHYLTHFVWFELARVEFFEDLIVVKISVGKVRSHCFTSEREVTKEEQGRFLVHRHRLTLVPFPTINYSQLGTRPLEGV